MDHKLCKDCKGFCCDDIGLDTPPHELQNGYHKWADDEGVTGGLAMRMSALNRGDGVLKWYGIHLMYSMLVLTHQDNIHPDGDLKTYDDNIVYHYYCKHHNKKTGDCDIYEERPMMCRTFPDNKFCGYRKVRDKRVKACRPKWFKMGMTQQEWSDGVRGITGKKTIGEQVKCKEIEPSEEKAEC